MSVAAIITEGIGPGSAINYVVTLGYDITESQLLSYVLSETLLLPNLGTKRDILANSLLGLPPDNEVGQVGLITSTLTIPGVSVANPVGAAASSIILPVQTSALLVS